MKKEKKNKRKQWTAHEEELLRREYNNVLHTDELAKRFRCTAHAVRQKARLLGLYRERRSSVWTPHRVEQLKQLYPNHTKDEIAQALDTTPGAVTAKAFELQLRKDKEWMRNKRMPTTFKKGQAPSNKGKKWGEYMSEEGQASARRTCFKKGSIPANHKPVGSEWKRKDRYWYVKVSETGGQWDRWKQKHRLLWEQHHGPIPKGTNIVFIDGNTDNIVIENLRAETMVEKFNRCCSIHTNMPPEMRQLVQLKGALRRQINRATGAKPKKRRERKENNPLKTTETDE